MASNTVYRAIRDYMTANWNSATASLAWENEQFSTPTSTGKPTPWVAVEMTGTLYGQQSIGAYPQSQNRWDEEGTLWMHVFVRSNTGSETARTICRSLADLFRGTTLLSGKLEFLDAQIGMGEPGDDEGNYFRISVSVDWRYIDA